MDEDKKKEQFCIPTKEVKSVTDLMRWEKSEGYQEYLGFIQSIGDAIAGKRIGEESIEMSEPTVKLVHLLETLSTWVDNIKPVEQQQRFGNRAFKEWHNKLIEESETLLGTLIANDEAIKEVQVYLQDSFGNSTRIDYGTGHEMAFVMFLTCLFHVKVFDMNSDLQAVGLVVFDKYMNLVRKLQTTYRMEPAGSQGVWSLDDYQFVSFIWGAAQLNGNESIQPKDISNYEKAEVLKNDYHFFGCIHYIGQVKTGPFAEHSNQLWNISGVMSWNKVYTGLIKMYRAEMLSKFPVIQHTYFGSIFRLDEAKDRRATSKLDAGRPPPRPKFNPSNLPKPPSFSVKQPN